MQDFHRISGLVPLPNSIELFDGEYTVTDSPVISFGPDGKDMRVAAESLAKSLRKIGREPVLQPSADAAGSYWLVLSDALSSPVKSDFPSGDESYQIDVTDHVEIRANSIRGAFYGAQTLAQATIAEPETLPRLTIIDQPQLAIRGLMVDLGRLKEKDEYYLELIDFMARHRMNTLFMHLADDEGAPIQFKSHPKLAGPYALTPDSIGKIIAYAAQRHVDIIPEIEVWGHAGWATNHPDYADISEGGPDLCTTNPKTWKFIGDLLDEVCEMFPSEYVHGGCDEAIFGLCPRCKAEVEKHGEDHLVGLHLKRVAEMIHERGKTPILWGDILLKYPGSVEMVPKYTIINHWDYDADPQEEPIELLKSKGFAVLAAPALVCRGRAVLPLEDSLQNVARTGQIAGKHKLMGVNNTIWAPQRVIADALWPGIALAAETSWSGTEPDRKELAARIFKSFFGIDVGEDLMEALRALHSIPIDVGMHVDGMWRDVDEFVALTDLKRMMNEDALSKSIEAAIKTLRSYRRKAARHKREYNALFLAAEMKKHICERRASPGRFALLLAGSRRMGLDPPFFVLHGMSVLMQSLVRREKDIYKLAEPYWDRWRYSDDPKKTYSAENILEAFRSSSDYMLTLSERLTRAAEKLDRGEEPDWDALL
jgi:hypothetical protein